MRKPLLILGLVSIAGAVASTQPAEAKKYRDFVCWTATGGYVDCDWLPPRYHVPGVKNPNCRRVPLTDRSEFTLYWPRVNSLGRQGVRTDNMRPTHWAQLQAVCR